MGMANDMKKLSEDILSSYKLRANEFQQRLKDNAALVKEVQKTLDGFRNDQMEMAATIMASAANLRSDLAKGEKDRLKSFNQMMSGINGSISQIQDEVEGIRFSTADMLKDFTAAHDEMASKLHRDLEEDKSDRMKWNSSRLKDFGKLMNNIDKEIRKVQKEVGDIFENTDALLKKFTGDHKKMSAQMRADLKSNLTERVEYTQKLLSQFDKRLADMGRENQKMAKALRLELAKSRKELSQSDLQRLKDFDVTFTGIQDKVREIRNYVDSFLGDFTADRKQAAATWAKLTEAIAKLGKNGEHEPAAKKPEPEPVKQAVKKEVLVEKKPEVIVRKEVEKVLKPKPVKRVEEIPVPKKELTLEQKVLEYINTHKKGVRVADMEKPFGETRMRIGFVTKKLLDEGKVQRIDNIYYPLTKK